MCECVCLEVVLEEEVEEVEEEVGGLARAFCSFASFSFFSLSDGWRRKEGRKQVSEGRKERRKEISLNLQENMNKLFTKDDKI